MPDLFLPFTPEGKATELTAVDVKRRLGLGPYEAVDPFTILPAVPARLVSQAELSAVPGSAIGLLFGRGSDDWSAVAFESPLRDGHEWIVLNYNHHPHRQRATLMEEIVHVVRGHSRVRLAFDGSGPWKRPFDDVIEDEAYNVGAACMIPYRWLFNAIRRKGLRAPTIATTFKVSVDYVNFRIKRAGLYHVYRKRQKTTVGR